MDSLDGKNLLPRLESVSYRYSVESRRMTPVFSPWDDRDNYDPTFDEPWDNEWDSLIEQDDREFAENGAQE